MQLSKRLKSAAAYVSKGNVTADVGCDHAYTSIYLVNNNIAPHVYAMDVNEGPIIRARKNVSDHGLDDKITVIRSDGLKEAKAEYGIQTVLISGMGGNLIIDILKAADLVNKQYDELVLQPQSDVARVRHYLHEMNYCIKSENMVYEDEKYYVIIKAAPGNEAYENEWEYEYGKYLIDTCNRTFADYISYVHKVNDRILDHLSDHDVNTETRKKRINDILKENEVIERILAGMHHTK